MVDDDLLELRVHGVSNTPPTSMLYAIQEEYGDSLAGVYGQRSNGLVRAFSWGGLARISPIPRIPFANWVRSVGSAAWIFVVPFGLANVAYWSRHLTMPGQQFRAARTTAALARVFSLGLTLLLASSVCSVSLDMAEARVLLVESPLPDWLSWLKDDLDAGDRMAIFSTAPLLAMLLLLALARWSRVRYDWGSKVSESAPSEPIVPGIAPPARWKFGSSDFWDNADLSSHSSAVHTAAGVALSLIWTGQFWFEEHRCVGVAVVVTSVAIVVGCLLLIASMPLVTEGAVLGPTRKALAWLAFWASLVIFTAQALALVFWHSPTLESKPLAGLSFVPGALVFMLLVLALSALGWRWSPRPSYVVAAVPIALGAVVLAIHQCQRVSDDNLRVVDSVLVVTLVLLAALWLSALYRRRAGHTEEAWGGTAPGVLMVLSLFAAMLLSTVFVLVAAALLGDGKIRINDEELMTAPPIYLSFASMLTPVVAALILLAVVVIWRIVLGCRTPVEASLDDKTQPDAVAADLAADFDAASRAPWWARRLRLGRLWQLKRLRSRTRKLAAVAHRAEPMVAAFAVLAGLAICFGLVLALALHDSVVAESVSPLHLARWLGVGLAVGLGGLIIGSGAARGRPLGIVWDLICFLPRAAHPFGPPCYAQRAVPELLNYCRAWLETPDTAKPRRLILSAHSLGGVLAVAIVLLLADTHKNRIALVTYGCQLRAYFGRIFPELLGPRILGVTNSHPARLLGCPTFGPAASAVPDNDGYPASVKDTLSDPDGKHVRWINLWRPTDYLGFPVYSRESVNPVDQPADEVTAEMSTDGKIVLAENGIDIHTLDGSVPMTTPVRFATKTTVRVDTHGDYFRAPQYPTAITDLQNLLAHAPAP
jgi:hypothetical protein